MEASTASMTAGSVTGSVTDHSSRLAGARRIGSSGRVWLNRSGRARPSIHRIEQATQFVVDNLRPAVTPRATRTVENPLGG